MVADLQREVNLALLLSSLFFAGFLYKPCVFRTLLDVHCHKEIEPRRISTSCKLLYCRFTGLSADSSFELFITDSSLQNVPECEGRSHELLRYVKIVGKTCHVLPPELREMQPNYGLFLSAKHLFLKVQGTLEVGFVLLPPQGFGPEAKTRGGIIVVRA